MLSAADNATRTLESKFKQTGEAIRRDLGQPIAIQAEFNLDGDPKRKYDEIVGSQKKILAEQKKINDKARTKQKLQDKISQAVKGTIAEKKEALKLVDRLMRTTGKTKDEMRSLAAMAKELKASLPKDADFPTAQKAKDLDTSLTGANLAANLATKAITAMGDAMQRAFATGVEMESLTLQMEAFTGGIKEAEIAMTQFKSVASKTPLDVMGVAEAGKIMMAYGVETGEAVEATERLAIASAATGGDINLLARNLGQVQAQGRAYTRDLTQFAIQGIPIWDELAKVTGKSVDQLKTMAKDGEIGMESVMQALRNMTKEGSAFAQVAERMQETFAGKFALIESEFQVMTGNMVEAFDAMIAMFAGNDWAQNTAEGLSNLGKIFETIKGATEEAGYEAVVMAGKLNALNKEKANFFERILVDPFENASTGAQLASTNMKAAAQAYRENNAELFGAKYAADQFGMTLQALTNKLGELAAIPGNAQLVQSFREQAQEAGQVTNKLQDQIQAAMDLADINNQRIQQEIDDYKTLKDEATTALSDIAQEYESKADRAKDAYARIEDSINSNIAAAEGQIEQLREQNRALQELGPAGEKLNEIRRKELEYTAKTGKELKGHVTDEEMKKLRAQATLERMDAQTKAQQNQEQILKKQKYIEEQKNQLKRDEQKLQADLIKVEQQKKAALQEQQAEVNNLNKKISSLIDVLNGNLAPNWDVIQDLIADAGVATSGVKGETDLYNTSIRKTITELQTVNRRLDDMKQKILNMPSLPSGPSNDGNRFAGGSVSGGSTYTVNELGKEAFLSASGRLSMINAPSWGEWTAPSSGTVIPAHLTKKLNVPTGGVNLNKTAGAGAGVGGAMRVISAAGGDTFHQNVTVQAANPVQAANNMMVEMTRLKRRRMGR